MKIPVRIIIEVRQEDDGYEFAWVYGPIWENKFTRISKNKWHLSVF